VRRASSSPTKRGSSRGRVIAKLRQLVQQRLSLFQIGGVEALSEPAVDRREEVAGFGTAALTGRGRCGDGSAKYPLTTDLSCVGFRT